MGYWIGEVEYPEINAIICPIVFSSDAKALSVEKAKGKWPILNEPFRALHSLKEIM